MKNKWMLGSLLSLAMTAGIFAGTAISSQAAEGDVAINEENFPDKNFRDYVLSDLDSDSNGVLSKEEIKDTTHLNCYSLDIKNLTGIEYFYNLTTLRCDDNQLTSLDVSNLTKLTELQCSDNQLTSLDLTNLTNLTELYCYGNKLTKLDLTNQTKLEKVFCIDNQLKTLSSSKPLPNLWLVYCSDNQLTTLDFTNMPNVASIYCDNNNLKSLNLSNLPELGHLTCNNNKLTSLDLSKNAALYSLSCRSNKISKLKFSTSCKSLTTFDCSNNNLTELDFPSGLFQECDDGRYELKINCSNNKLTCLSIKQKGINLNICEFNTDDNVRYVSANADNQFDLSTLKGFDVKKASNWKGGKVSGKTLTFTKSTVTYTYKVNAPGDDREITANFTLKKCSHKKDAVKKTTKASFSKNGSVKTVCPDCGKSMKKSTTIYKMETPKLSKTSYTYTGKAKKPSVTVKNSKGTQLKEGTHYTVTYASGRKNVGTYKVTIKGKGKYTGSVTKTFKINPAATEITKLSAAVKGFTVKWSKVTDQTTGYQIKYSLNKDFSDSSAITIKDNTVTSKKITGLKAGKKYYVKVRTYKKVGDKNYYSSWSEVKGKTTKK